VPLHTPEAQSQRELQGSPARLRHVPRPSLSKSAHWVVAVQVKPHVPQALAAARPVSQPFALLPSQLPDPDRHWMVHAPAWQTPRAPNAGAHTVPQAPQFFASVRVSMQMGAAPPRQQAKPDLQVSPDWLAAHGLQSLPSHTWLGSGQSAAVSHGQPCAVQPHCPAAQLTPAAQALPHAPQCAAVERVSTHEPPQQVAPPAQRSPSEPGPPHDTHAPATHT
jgi:hypothetical protein